MKQATFTPFPADWARSSHFQYYTKGFVKSVNSMTVRIDVTHFLAEVKRRNLKFFPAFAALTGQVIASIPEMCTAVDENGTPGYYSYLNPNFTIFHEDDKTFSDVWSEYDADFDAFYQNLVADAAQYQDKKGIKVKEGQPANFFCISCVPWLDYTAYCPVNYGGAAKSFPASHLREIYRGGRRIYPPPHAYHQPRLHGRLPSFPILPHIAAAAELLLRGGNIYENRSQCLSFGAKLQI